MRRQISRGHEKSRGTETALEGMMVTKSLLNRRHLTVAREAFDGDQFGAIGLNREHQAGTDADPVEYHRARPAYTMLASEPRRGESKVIAEKIRQGLPHRHFPLD